MITCKNKKYITNKADDASSQSVNDNIDDNNKIVRNFGHASSTIDPTAADTKDLRASLIHNSVIKNNIASSKIVGSGNPGETKVESTYCLKSKTNRINMNSIRRKHDGDDNSFETIGL